MTTSQAGRAIAIELAERQGWRCPLCGDPLPKDDLTIDHIIPRAKGGISAPVNYQVTHRACNQLKGGVKHYLGNCWICKRAVDSEHDAESHYARMHPRNRRRPDRPNGKRRRH